MRVVVVTPPEPVIALDQAKLHLRVDGDDEDALITGMIAAATAHIDGPMGWLGRAIGVQTLEARLDHFGCGSIVLPYPPTIAVTAVKHIDVNGVEQTVDAGVYELLGASLVSNYGVTWPAVRYQREAVRVRYTAGYVVLPAPIGAAILLMVGDLYAFRETAGMSSAEVPMSPAVGALLAPFRVFV